jgi:Vam6/Vps39-like protein vacuolar protein sorting-associated protein 39
VSSTASFVSTTVVEIRSSISLLTSQTLAAPFKAPAAGSVYSNYSTRLVTPSPGGKSPLFLLTTSNDRSTATAEGSTLWSFTMKTWGEQVDEMVSDGAYADALALLDSLDVAILPDKVRSS